MSQIIKSVFENYLVCAIIGGFVEYLTPDKMKKTVRICVVGLMLSCIFLPVMKDNFKNVKLPMEEIAENEAYNALYHTANLMEQSLYTEIKNILINQGVNEYEIYITTTPNIDNNTVYLDEIKIEVHKDYKKIIPDIVNAIPEEYTDILKVGVKNE